MKMQGNQPVRHLTSASQAEILRSHQRDLDFIQSLRKKFVEILHDFGRHKTLLYLTCSEIPASAIYFLFTTFMGNQTLGEEYTGIVQANLGTYKVPPLRSRVLAVILELFGEYTLLKLLSHIHKSVNNPGNELTPTAISFLNAFLSKIRSIIPIFILMHKGLFFIYGRHYSLGKRIMGIAYAKIYGNHPSNGISWGLRLLGVATLMQCILKYWQAGSAEGNNEKALTSTEKRIRQVCYLCMEVTPTSATPCGHLFCWDCLYNWLQAKNQCPLCRQHVIPSRVVHLMNL